MIKIICTATMMAAIFRLRKFFFSGVSYLTSSINLFFLFLITVYCDMNFSSCALAQLTQIAHNNNDNNNDNTALLTCDLNPIDLNHYRIIRTDISDPQKIPHDLRKFLPGDIIDLPEFSILLIEKNDNDFTGGLWSSLADQPYDKHHAGGDDQGFTHELTLIVTAKIQNNWNLKALANSALYTSVLKKSDGSYQINKRLDGDHVRSFYTQNFTNQTLLKLVLDNKPEHKNFYYQLGVGFVELDSVQSNLWYQGTKQQDTLHRKIMNVYSYDNKARPDLPNSASPEIELALGYIINLINEQQTCRWSLSAEAGADLDDIGGSNLQLTGKENFYYQKEGKKFIFFSGFSENLMLHEQGVQGTVNFHLGVQWQHVGIEFEHTQNFGTLLNNVTFNVPSTYYKSGNDFKKYDPMLAIKLRFILGKMKSAPKDAKSY